MNHFSRRTIYCGFGAVVGAGYGCVVSIAAFDGEGIGTILVVVVSTAIVAFWAKGIATEPAMSEGQKVAAVLMAPMMFVIAMPKFFLLFLFLLVELPFGACSWLRGRFGKR